jgi:hypothetical protein
VLGRVQTRVSSVLAAARAAHARAEPRQLSAWTLRSRAAIMRWVGGGEDAAAVAALHELYASDPEWAPRSATPGRLAVMGAGVFNAMADHQTLSALFSSVWYTYTDTGGVSHTVELPADARALLIASVVMGFVTTALVLLRMFSGGADHRLVVDLSVIACAASAALLVTAAAGWQELVSTHAPPTASDVHLGVSLVAVALATAQTLLATLLLAADRLLLGSIDRLLRSDRRFVVAVLALSMWISLGALVYRAIEGWSYNTSVYFVIATVTTIGYGNITPVTLGGRLFTYPYALLGIVGVAFTLDATREKLAETVAALARLVERRHQARRRARRGAVPDAVVANVHPLRAPPLLWSWTAGLVLVALLWLGGAGVFVALQRGWNYNVATWFTFATVLTIGYGDFVPTDAGAVLFLEYYIFLGLTVLAYLLALMGETTRRSVEARFAKADVRTMPATPMHHRCCQMHANVGAFI